MGNLRLGREKGVIVVIVANMGNSEYWFGSWAGEVLFAIPVTLSGCLAYTNKISTFLTNINVPVGDILALRNPEMVKDTYLFFFFGTACRYWMSFEAQNQAEV